MPMVGREAELEALVDAFGAVLASRQAQAVTVVGDAGLGKSRLLAEFQHTLRAQTCWFLLGRAHPRSPQQPFGLLRDLLARQFAIGDSDDAELARQKLVSGLAPLFADEGAAPIHLIGQLIGLDFSASPHLKDLLDDERSLRDQAFRSAALCLRRMAGHRPVLPRAGPGGIRPAGSRVRRRSSARAGPVQRARRRAGTSSRRRASPR